MIRQVPSASVATVSNVGACLPLKAKKSAHPSGGSAGAIPTWISFVTEGASLAPAMASAANISQKNKALASLSLK